MSWFSVNPRYPSHTYIHRLLNLKVLSAWLKSSVFSEDRNVPISLVNRYTGHIQHHTYIHAYMQIIVRHIIYHPYTELFIGHSLLITYIWKESNLDLFCERYSITGGHPPYKHTLPRSISHQGLCMYSACRSMYASPRSRISVLSVAPVSSLRAHHGIALGKALARETVRPGCPAIRLQWMTPGMLMIAILMMMMDIIPLLACVDLTLVTIYPTGTIVHTVMHIIRQQ